MKKYGVVGLLGLALAGLLAVPSAASAADDETSGSAAGVETDGSHAEGFDRYCARQLDRTIKGFDDAFFAHDQRFLAVYDDNVTLILPNGALRNTKTEAREHWRGVFASTIWTAKFTELKRTIDGCHSAVLTSDAIFEIPSRNYKLHFVNSVSFKRDHGQWHIVLDQSTTIP